MAKHRLPDGRLVDINLPDWLRLTIGDIAVVSARVENMLIGLLWEMEGADLNHKRQIAAKSFSQNIDHLRKVLLRVHPDSAESLATFWPKLKAISRERALFIHGDWYMIDGEAYAMLHGAHLHSDKELTAELVTRERLGRLQEILGVVYTCLLDVRKVLGE